jgi:hypothetical protein
MAGGLGGDRERAAETVHHNKQARIHTVVSHPEAIRFNQPTEPHQRCAGASLPYGLAAAQLPVRACGCSPPDLGLRTSRKGPGRSRNLGFQFGEPCVHMGALEAAVTRVR